MLKYSFFILASLISLPILQNPGCEEEVCDGVDNDGDGEVDEGFDVDGDGYMDPDSCAGVYEVVDCDDNNPDSYPGAYDEACDGVDMDCDGSDGLGETYYLDADGDGFGDPETGMATCEPDAGWVQNDEDCNDADASIFPGASEGVADGIDQDCDGTEICYQDADEDGYRPDDDSLTQVSEDLDCDDPSEASAEDPSGDCNDEDSSVHPDAAEICEGMDTDCDGVAELKVSWEGHDYLFCYLPGMELGWDPAEAHCRELGMALSAVSNQAEFDYVTGTWLSIREGATPIQNHTGRDEYVLFIGLYDSEVEQAWVWSSGDEYNLGNYDDNPWCPYEPNNAGIENCAATGWSSNYGNGLECPDYGWNNLSCTTELPYLCESVEAQ